MWVLIFMVINSGNVTTNSVEFSEQMLCLKTMNNLIDWESKTLKIKATCVKK